MAEHAIKRVQTGISGLDGILCGGIPAKSIILLCGRPGVGKTIITLQYTMAAISRGEPVVYVSIEESMDSKIRNALSFGWDLVKAEHNDLLEVFDISMISPNQNIEETVEIKGHNNFNLEAELEKSVRRLNAKHVIIDPLTSILINEPRSGKKRYIVSNLFDTIRNLKCTAIITSESIPSETDFYMEQFLADGVILLNKDILNYNLIKTIRVDKMRAVNFDEQPRRYYISDKGFQINNNEPVLT